MVELSSKVSGSSKIFFRGAGADATSDSVQGLFSKYGDIVSCFAVPGQGCGYVEFHLFASAEKVLKDTGSISLQGKTIEVKRAVPPLASSVDLGVAPQCLVEPSKGAQALDVVVIRGAATSTGIGVAALHAKAMSTVLVLWDHRHYAAKEANMAGALEKRVYQTMQEEMADNAVMGKAFEYYGSGAPKCALLHVCDDQIKQSVEMENPLWNVDAVMDGINSNHVETLRCFYAWICYQPWVHAFRACAFALIPPMMNWDWPDDLCCSALSSRRSVKADPLRNFDGSGWTIGLQLTLESPVMSASLAHSAMMSCVLADEGTKAQYSGKNMTLSMPTSDLWFKKSS